MVSRTILMVSFHGFGRSGGKTVTMFYATMRVSLGTTMRLLPCDLEVTGSTPGNNLYACGGKAAYIYPPQIPPCGSSCTGPPFNVLCYNIVHLVIIVELSYLYGGFFSTSLDLGQDYAVSIWRKARGHFYGVSLTDVLIDWEALSH